MKYKNDEKLIASDVYRTVDLCAGIGGIRKGFELSGFKNVLSAEIDEWACEMYKHLFGDTPNNDLTTDEFKDTIEQTDFEVLLAGFPCQSFSSVGLKEGFKDVERGQIFFHISTIIERTRPQAIFLENVGHLTTHDEGKTFKAIIETLCEKNQYKIIGVEVSENGELEYSPRSFIRNSRDFGVPQNRPRTYIIGFDKKRFSDEKLASLSNTLPRVGQKQLYESLLELLETDVEPKYYMASGYLETLKKHKIREKEKGNGFGHSVVNLPGIEKPVANTLLAIGGSGKERNLILQEKEGIGGIKIGGKKTPLNSEGIRVMTPVEWGKLQGFINYAFRDDKGVDSFSFIEGMKDTQKYKQFGNSVTIPVIEEMARFIKDCLKILNSHNVQGCI